MVTVGEDEVPALAHPGRGKGHGSQAGAAGVGSVQLGADWWAAPVRAVAANGAEPVGFRAF